MRYQRLIFAAVVACTVSACAKDITGVTHNPPPLAYVRFINAVPDTFNLDFRAIDQVAYSTPFLNVKYRGLGDGNYQGYQAGLRHIRVFLDPSPANNTAVVDPAIVSTVVDSLDYTFVAGQYYTIISAGSARAKTTQANLLVVADTFTQGAGVQGRIFNLASVQGGVDVYVGPDSTTPLVLGNAVASNLLPLKATKYLNQATGAYVMRLTAPGTPAAQIGGAAVLQAGTPGNSTVDPVFGSGQAGSVFTAFIFDASVVGSPATQFATVGVVYYPDMQPPRTTSP